MRLRVIIKIAFKKLVDPRGGLRGRQIVCGLFSCLIYVRFLHPPLDKLGDNLFEYHFQTTYLEHESRANTTFKEETKFRTYPFSSQMQELYWGMGEA